MSLWIVIPAGMTIWCLLMVGIAKALSWRWHPDQGGETYRAYKNEENNIYEFPSGKAKERRADPRR